MPVEKQVMGLSGSKGELMKTGTQELKQDIQIIQF